MIPWGYTVVALFAGLCIGVGLVGLCGMNGRMDAVEAFREGYRKGVSYSEGLLNGRKGGQDDTLQNDGRGREN